MAPVPGSEGAGPFEGREGVALLFDLGTWAISGHFCGQYRVRLENQCGEEFGGRTKWRLEKPARAFVPEGRGAGSFCSHLVQAFNSARLRLSHAELSFRPGVTASPTGAPTASPTDPPAASPTDSPTKSPTDSPASSPTDSPTASPTDSLTASSTGSQTASPTDSPTASPTDSPTASPTDSPASSVTDMLADIIAYRLQTRQQRHGA